jgi:phage regulator Rha-like protein
VSFRWIRGTIMLIGYARVSKSDGYRSFDLTRNVFTLLIMGWTGKRAKAFKVR